MITLARILLVLPLAAGCASAPAAVPGEAPPPEPLRFSDTRPHPFALSDIPVTFELPFGTYQGNLGGQAFEMDGRRDPHLDLEDLWVGGAGFTAQALVHFHVMQTFHQDHSVGVALIFNRVVYEGEAEPDPVLGGTLRVGDLRLTELLLAAHMRSLFGRFSIAGHVGVGVAWIGSVDGSFEPSGGGATVRGDLYRASRVGAFELGFRVGGSVPMGSSAAIGMYAMIGLGSTGAPSEGDLLRQIDPDIDALGLGPSYIGFGMSLEFGGVRRVKK